MRCDARRLAHVLQPKGDGAAHHVRTVEVLVLVLEPRRGRRLEGARGWRIRVNRAPSEVEPQVRPLPQHHRSRLAILWLVLQVGRRHDVVPLTEVVEAAGERELQPLRRRGDGVHARGRCPEDAPHILVIRQLCECLQWVRGRERVRRIHAVDGAQVHDARRRREHQERARPRVVVVRDPALCQAVHRAQVDADLEAASQELVQVRPNGLLLVAGVGSDPTVLFHETGDEVRRLIVPTGDAGVGFHGELMLAEQDTRVVEIGTAAAAQLSGEG